MSESGEQPIADWVNDIHQGDAADTLADMPASSVHCVMTSPPYFGLRDYGVDGQIGLEESLDDYIQTLVDVGEQLQRVLRDDGSWWLNLGDTYGPDKQKMLVPHQTAIELQNAGWVVRNDAVWAKPNAMPESVKDRLSTTFEFVFHLTQQEDYWYDLDAIREPYSDYTQRMKHRSESDVERGEETEHGGIGDSSNMRADIMHPDGKNPGDVFEIPVKPFSDAHFAVYPPELCVKPIKATCPEGGIVLDPFAGAGTTCLVAKRLGRRFVGVDLNPDYVALAQKRVGVTVDEPERLLDDEETALTAFTDGGRHD